MRADEVRLDAGVEGLIADNRKTIFAPGSEVAVLREAPVVTGDGVMDTQLENLRRILCSRVHNVYRLVLRAKAIRLWSVEREGKPIPLPPSVIKREDHPLVQTLVRQALELEKIDRITCEAYTDTGEKYLDSKLQLQQVQTRLRALSDIQGTVREIERLGTEALRQAQDLIKAFHAMAQQYRIHRDKLDAGSDKSDVELMKIASAAVVADKPVKSAPLESFLDPNGQA